MKPVLLPLHSATRAGSVASMHPGAGTSDGPVPSGGSLPSAYQSIAHPLEPSVPAPTSRSPIAAHPLFVTMTPPAECRATRRQPDPRPLRPGEPRGAPLGTCYDQADPGAEERRTRACAYPQAAGRWVAGTRLAPHSGMNANSATPPARPSEPRTICQVPEGGGRRRRGDEPHGAERCDRKRRYGRGGKGSGAGALRWGHNWRALSGRCPGCAAS